MLPAQSGLLAKFQACLVHPDEWLEWLLNAFSFATMRERQVTKVVGPRRYRLYRGDPDIRAPVVNFRMANLNLQRQMPAERKLSTPVPHCP